MKVKVYKLKITLRGVRPAIWRRIEVAGDTTLGELHTLFQKAMGWNHAHLHVFRFGKGEEHVYGIYDPAYDLYDKDETKYTLQDVVKEAKQSFHYMYDFGDGWVHTILVESIDDPAEGVWYPRVLAGKRACPPEDCGGPWGYQHYLEAIGDPEHEEHESYLEWRGPFDAEAWDIESKNRLFRMWEGCKLLVGAQTTYTKKQGQYLAFIYYYTKLNRRPPAQTDIASYFGVSGPSVSHMLKKLDELGLIARVPGKARCIELLVSRADLPDLL